MGNRNHHTKVLRIVGVLVLAVATLWGSMPVPAMAEITPEISTASNEDESSTCKGESTDRTDDNLEVIVLNGNGSFDKSSQNGIIVVEKDYSESDGFANVSLLDSLKTEMIQPEDNGESEGILAEAALADMQASNIIASGTWGTCPWEITVDGTLVIHDGMGANDSYSYRSPWESWKDSIEAVRTACSGGNRVVAPASCTYLFCNLSLLSSFDAHGWDMSNVTRMDSMFEGCHSLDSLDLSDWNTSKVTYLKGMFRNCYSLVSLDLSNWDISRSSSMSSMFAGCSNLRSIDLSGWTTGNAFPTFSECPSLVSLDLTNWDLSKTTSLNSLLAGCSNLRSLNLSGWNTSRITEMSGTFRNCKYLVTLDLSGWNTSRVKSVSSMFSGCTYLENLNLSDWSTSNITDMSGMFYDCSSLKRIDFSGWDTSNVANMSSMFSGCSSLNTLDISNWNTSWLTNMSGMFQSCSNLASLDLSGWNTSLVTDMSFVFSGCSHLSSIDLSGWDTSWVTNMSSMFHGCSSLTTLDLSKWDTSRLANVNGIFRYCSSLVHLDLTGWDTSKVPGSSSDMFGHGYSYLSSELPLLAMIKVGNRYSMMNYGMFPVATAQNGKWWSETDRVWYTTSEIIQKRSGIADTYRNWESDPAHSIDRVTISPISAQTYTGKSLTPALEIRLDNKKLTLDADYTLIYKNNVALSRFAAAFPSSA